MAAKIVHGDHAGWVRVAEWVTTRRMELGMTQAKLADAAGISVPVVQVVEAASQPRDTVALRTALGLCRALKWTPDSIDRILTGDTPLSTGEGATDPAVEMRRLGDEIAGLRAQVAELLAKFGHDPSDLIDG